jgi:hypothetical protein
MADVAERGVVISLIDYTRISQKAVFAMEKASTTIAGGSRRYIQIRIRIDLAHYGWFPKPIFYGILQDTEWINPEILALEA